MSVQTEIDRIKTSINNAYTAISEMGGVVPVQKSVANLADSIKTVKSAGRWVLIESYTSAGEVSFTVPPGVDLIGVTLIGGGESGAGRNVMMLVDSISGLGTSYTVNGGSSGEVVNFIKNVTPGATITGVVGAGGIGKSHTLISKGDINLSKNIGGDTSFGSFIAHGGSEVDQQGLVCDNIIVNGTYVNNTYSFENHNAPANNKHPFVYDFGASSVSEFATPRQTIYYNEFHSSFDDSLYRSCGGGTLIGKPNSNSLKGFFQTGNGPSSNKGGDGVYMWKRLLGSTPIDVLGNDAIGYGNGGGGCVLVCYSTTYTAGLSLKVKAGSGSDGAIFIYALQ